MLQKIYITLIASLLIFTVLPALGQSILFENNKTFRELEIIPANPSENDTIVMILRMENHRPNSGYFRSQWVVQEKQIKISAHYLRAYAYQYPTYEKRETIILGKLSPGLYTVELIRTETTIYTTVEPPHDQETRLLDRISCHFSVKLNTSP